MNLLSKPIFLAIVGAVVLVLVAGGGYFYFKSTQTPKINPQDQKGSQQEVKKLVAEVGKLIELPTGEDPTVATVIDVEKLKNQPFFKNAKNGDKVLIYPNNKKIILYDPQAKKLLDVAPFSATPSAQVVSPAPSPSSF